MGLFDNDGPPWEDENGRRWQTADGRGILLGHHGPSMTGRLATAEAAEQFILAGNATVTLRSVATGARFTFKVKKPDDFKEDRPIWFVSLLNGPDNDRDFQYMGQLRLAQGTYRYDHGKKSRVGLKATSTAAWVFFTRNLFERNRLHEGVECWHEGRCGRCNRKLTVPESVELGFGPDCAEEMGL